MEGDDGSCYDGGQCGYLKKPGQQFPSSLKAQLPNIAQLEFPCVPEAPYGHLSSLPPAAGGRPRVLGDMRGGVTKTEGAPAPRRLQPPFPETPASLVLSLGCRVVRSKTPGDSAGRARSCTDYLFERALGPNPSLQESEAGPVAVSSHSARLHAVSRGRG